MRKLLLSILLLVACQPMQGALVTLPSPVYYPALQLYGTVAVFTHNDVTDELAVAFQIPVAGTLTDVAPVTATVTTGEANVPFRLETVGTDGNPSGTLVDAAGTGTLTIASTDDNVPLPVPINSGTGITVTAGTVMFLRWKTAGTFNGQFSYLGSGPSRTDNSGLPGVYDYNITAGAAWTKTVGIPIVHLKIGGVWYAPPGCLGGVTSLATNEAFQSPVQRSILINLPMSVRARGVSLTMFPAASTTFQVDLHSDHLATPDVAASSPVVDSDMINSTTVARRSDIYFSTAFVTTASTPYLATLTPLGAVNVSWQYYTVNATYAASFPTGATGTYWARADRTLGLEFTETPTRLPRMALIIDQIDIGGASAGGQFISDLGTGSPIAELVRNYWLGVRQAKQELLWLD